MAEDDIKAALTTMHAQLGENIMVADELDEPRLAALLCEAQWCVEQLIKK